MFLLDIKLSWMNFVVSVFSLMWAVSEPGTWRRADALIFKATSFSSVSHRFLEQKCNVKSKSLWLQHYCGPARKLLFLGFNPSRRSLNPSPAAAGGRTALLIVCSASYGCCSLDSHLDSLTSAVSQEQLRDVYHLRRSSTLRLTTGPQIWFTLKERSCGPTSVRSEFTGLCLSCTNWVLLWQ